MVLVRPGNKGRCLTSLSGDSDDESLLRCYVSRPLVRVTK